MAQVTLGGYPAKQCARLTHNEYAPGTPEPVPVAPDVAARLDAGLVFEREIVDELRRRHAGSPRLLVLDDEDGWSANQRRTAAAMAAAVEVIVGGRLPDVGGRVGAPDLLLRHRDGYLPVDIKHHRTLTAATRPDSPAATAVLSTLTAPDRRIRCPGYRATAPSRLDDVMQLAHYTRMLQQLGVHPGVNLGGIIGTSDLTAPLGDHPGITWYDLDAERVTAYSASAPGHRAVRSVLAHYDHEFGFRLAVAEAARAGAELVRPYRIGDCDSCVWFDYCASVAGEDDASFAIETGHLNVREWQYLYRNCGTGDRLTVGQLAAVDIAAHTTGFRQHSVNTADPDRRLAEAVARAQMTVDGRDLDVRGPMPPPVPCADVEVDFDIEWDVDGRIYQWGLRIRDGQDDSTARYQPIASFDRLDEAGELRLAEEFAARIRDLRTRADRDGRTLRVFHWHHPEISRTRRFAAVAAALDGLTVDLLKWFRAGYFARISGSIKAVGAIFGFHWDVEDPGGALAQAMIETARGDGPDAENARRWCLAYNECDVTAQAVIRDGLRRFNAQPPARPPC